ncbi:MAG TPA: type IVB secretion system protein IcmH/DotU, partial [Terriglobales bacterium]|nr:type IVB secretion system protein IcmH/DotU [Terriglobales bacterium]
INGQEERVKSTGVPLESYREARFAVLSWVDEMILNSTWPQRSQWQHLMLAYYGTFNAGEEFFRRLEMIPSQATDVREIYFLCLSLGFQGKYAFGDGHFQLKDLRHNLYRQLSGGDGDIRQIQRRVFPEAYPTTTVKAAARQRLNPWWYVAVLFVPVFLFACFWFLLRAETNRLIASLDKPITKPIEVDWYRSLVEELRRKGIPAEDTPRGVLITLGSLLFEVNSADLNRQAERKIDDIVETVKRYAPERAIVVEGHASREPGVEEERNQRLSEERARTVAEAFARSGFRREKLTAQGFGSRRPVVSNSTEAGRTQNRRVEIIVAK